MLINNTIADIVIY